MSNSQDGLKIRRMKKSWKSDLAPEDFAELGRWVEQSGVECVARVAAALTDPEGERGAPNSPRANMLLEMASLRYDDPNLTTNAAATKIARAAYAGADPNDDRITTLTTQLNKDFAGYRSVFGLLAQRPDRGRNVLSKAGGKRSLPTQRFILMKRAEGRIVETLPTAIDLYDALLLEAKACSKEKLLQVKSLGRERAEQLLGIAMAEQMAGSQLVDGKIPRSFLDLIDPELRKLPTAKRTKKDGRSVCPI
jgi:hypothetical protein